MHCRQIFGWRAIRMGEDGIGLRIARMLSAEQPPPACIPRIPEIASGVFTEPAWQRGFKVRGIARCQVGCPRSQSLPEKWLSDISRL